MLTISDQQFSRLESQFRSRFIEELAAYAFARFPDVTKTVPLRALIDFVSDVVRQAGAYGMTSQRDIAVMIDLSVMYGRDFHTAFWARPILEMAEWTATRKAEALRRKIDRLLQSA